MKNNLLWVIILVLVTSCEHKSAEQLYADHINDPGNKMIQSLSVGDVTATARWLPAPYRQLMNNHRINKSSDQEDNSYHYFDLKFYKHKGDKPDMSKVLYLDFDIQKDFVLLKGNDSIPPVICQKIENGIGGSYEYMIAFENNQPVYDEGFSLIYHDKVFGIGTIAFVYDQSDIKKIPVLKKEDTK